MRDFEDPKAFLETVTPDRRRREGLELLGFFNQLTGLSPYLQKPGLVAYGRYRYAYKSGRTGDWFLTAFAPRKAALTIHVMPGYRDISALLDRLGPHKMGQACLYVKKLEDIDQGVLAEILVDSLAHMRANYEVLEG